MREPLLLPALLACGSEVSHSGSDATAHAVGGADDISVPADVRNPSGSFKEGAVKPHGQLDASSLFEIGLRHMREDHPEAAIDHFDRAIILDAGNARLHDARGSALFALGKFTEALSASEAAVSLLADDPGLHVNRGLIYQEFGRIEEAMADYSHALELSPGYVPALYNRGVLHFNAADNELALADFDAAIIAQPELANPYFNRAMVHETLGDIEKAKADMALFMERTTVKDQQDLAHTLLERWGEPRPVDPALVAFQALVARCSMEFQLPSGFDFSPGRTADGLDYEAVLRVPDGSLEVRLALRCLQDAEVDYQDPHSAKPAPEHIYPLLYTAIVQEISADPHSASEGFGDNALSEFNADWGQMSIHAPTPDFGGDYSSMLFVALHRRSAADAYLVFLFDEYSAVKESVNSAMKSLRFADS